MANPDLSCKELDLPVLGCQPIGISISISIRMRQVFFPRENSEGQEGMSQPSSLPTFAWKSETIRWSIRLAAAPPWRCQIYRVPALGELFGRTSGWRIASYERYLHVYFLAALCVILYQAIFTDYIFYTTFANCFC